MTTTNEKLRSLFLAALMVFSVFGGTVALTGNAAALTAGNAAAGNTAAGASSQLTVSAEIEQSDIDEIGNDVDGIEIAFNDPDADNGLPSSSSAYSVNVYDASGTLTNSGSLNGGNGIDYEEGSAILTFSSQNIEADGEVEVVISGYQNPSTDGTYSGSIQLNPNSNGPSTGTTLQIGDGDGVNVTDFDAPAVAADGQDITVSANVTNTGGSSEDFDVTYSATNEDTTTTDDPAAGTSTQTVNLDGGESTEVSFNVNTADLPDNDSTDLENYTHNITAEGVNTGDTDEEGAFLEVGTSDPGEINVEIIDQGSNPVNTTDVALYRAADWAGSVNATTADPIRVDSTDDQGFAQFEDLAVGPTESASFNYVAVGGYLDENFSTKSTQLELFRPQQTSDSATLRLERNVNPDDIQVVDTDSPAVVNNPDASVTVQVTTDDLDTPGQPFEGETVTASIVSATVDAGAASVVAPTSDDTDENGEVTFSINSSEVQDVTVEFTTTNGLTTQQTVTFVPEDGEGVFVAQVKDKATAEELENATVYAVRESQFNQNNISFTNETNVDDNDQALFRVVNEDTNQTVDNEDYDITFNDSSDFVRVNELNESDGDIGQGFLGTAGPGSDNVDGTGAFEFTVTPLEPGNYTIQSTDVGDLENPGEANFTNTSAANVEVTQNLTAAAIAEQAEETDADPVGTTNENGQATLTGLVANGKIGQNYTVMAERVDYARQYQDANIQSYDTDRNIVERTFLLEEKDVEPDSVNITQFGVHPPLSETGGPDPSEIVEFNDQDDDTSQTVPRDGSVDVIQVSATATNFQGEVVDDLDTNVTVGLNDDFDGQFLPTAIGGTVVNVNNSSDSPTVTVSTDGDSEATVLLETVQNDTTLRTNKTATLESDSGITDESNVTFVGTTVFETGSVSGIVTNENNQPIIGSVVYVEEFVSQNGTVFTIEAEDNLTGLSRAEVLNSEFTVTNTDSGENVTVTGETLEAYEIDNGTGNGFDTVTLNNATSTTLLTFPSEEQGQAQYTLPRVPAQDPTGVDYTRVAGVELDSGTEGVGDTDSPVQIDFTQEANVVIVGAEPTDGNFEVSNLSAPANVSAGEEFSVNATVTNNSPVPDTKTIEFRVDGETEVDQQVSLDAGESTTVEFPGLSLDEPGTYTHGIFADNNATAQITVTNETSSGVERFDTNGDPGIQFQEVIAAIQASNDGTQIGGEDVGFQDVLVVIEAFNDQN